MPNKILRTLIYDDAQKERKVIGQDQIAAITEPVVILGDPGLGKSVLTQMLGEQPGMKYYRAGTFVRSANPGSMITGSERIIIDGLDEIASTALGGGVELVLKQLSAMGSPPFILSCREADWRGATDRIKIEDDYSTTPCCSICCPLTAMTRMPSCQMSFLRSTLATFWTISGAAGWRTSTEIR